MRKPLSYFAWKAAERTALAISEAFVAIHAATLCIIFLTIAEDAGERARLSLGVPAPHAGGWIAPNGKYPDR